MTSERRADIALLVARLCLGTAFVVHGYPKILHPTTWLHRALPAFPAWLGAVAAFVEFGGGIAIAAGFATPVFAFLIACDMAVVIFFVMLPRGVPFVNLGGSAGYELPLAYLVIALVLIILGPGAFALDAARPVRRRRR